ncbi:MAG: hypothetical protein IKM66_03015 [Clostridia bacterium]|nr:hypothetical protein [Clostridia bacterium]
MIVLYILIGIVVLFALVLSIRAHIHVEYEKELTAYAKWAFIKIPLIPFPEKQPKPKKDEPVKKEEPPAEETPKEPKPKGPNPLKTIYENEQIHGILEILRNLLEIIDKFGRRLVNSFVIDEMFLDIEVTKGDAAQTAEEYGKICRTVFPVTGAVCANCNVKKYSINVEPDYIANPGTRVAFSMEISLNPRKLINAVLAFAFSAVFKIGIRLIKDLKPKTPAAVEQQNTEKTNDINTIESGAQ